MSGPPPSQANASVTPAKNTATTQMPTHIDLRCLSLPTAAPPCLLTRRGYGETAGGNLPAEVDGVVPLRDFGLGGLPLPREAAPPGRLTIGLTQTERANLSMSSRL